MTPDYSFQPVAVDLVLSALAAHSGVVLQAPTGAGKTRMAISIARRVAGPVLFVAESPEIIGQTVGAYRALGLDVEALTRDRDTREGAFGMIEAPYVVMAQRTGWSRGVRARHDIGEYRTIIIDEAHHIRARTYQELLDLWPEAKKVLLTATPVRGDGKGLGNVAEVMVQGDDYDGNYQALTRRGVLVPCPRDKVWSWPADMRGIRKQAGDYVMGGKQGAAQKFDTPKLIGDIVAHHRKWAGDRPTIAYASSVAHAEHIETAFRDVGVEAATVHAKTPKEDREGILAALGEGRCQVVANFGVLTEGFDCPPVSCIVLARRTDLIGLYIQMVGRGLRACDGKADLMLMDHVGNVPVHGLPGTDIHWEFATDRRAARNNDTRRAVPCPECHAILLTNGTCGSCGWKPQFRVAPPNANGFVGGYDASDADTSINLVRLSDDRAAEIETVMTSPQRTEYLRLRGVAFQRGFKPGWAAHKYKDRFGEWPDPRWDLPNPTRCTPAEFLAAAQKVATDRGWKQGWAAHTFKDTYGEFPPR